MTLLDQSLAIMLDNDTSRHIKAPIETSTESQSGLKWALTGTPWTWGCSHESIQCQEPLPASLQKAPRGRPGMLKRWISFWVSCDVHGVLMAFLCWYPALLKTPVRWLIGNFKHALVSSTPVGKRSYDHFWPLLDAWHNFWNWVTQAQTNWVPSHFSCPGSLVLCHGQKKVR